jgi:hypothetical protein
MKYLASLALLALLTLPALAGEPDSTYYRPLEVAIDTFVGAEHDRNNLDRMNGNAGAGIQYYHTESLGFAMHTSFDREGQLLDRGQIGPRFRLPMGRLAPYVLGGIGYDFTIRQEYYFGGGGLEVRLSPRLGVFAEGQYNYVTDGGERDVTSRVGLRFAF